MLAPEGQYYNYSGCGNTFNCNHPHTRKFILDCLRYWVLEMHVDGFRFDLASIMTRAPSIWHTNADGNAASAFSEEGSIPLPPQPPKAPKRSFDQMSAGGEGGFDSDQEDEIPTERSEGAFY